MVYKLKQTLASLEPLLRSNVAPLPQQTSDVTSVISHFTEQLDGVESRIARLRDELSQLESSKAELQEEIEKYSPILSPVRSIPPEIIRTIMLDCYDEEAFDEGQVRDMALVSRQWYKVAVSTPLLWSAYTIDTTYTPKLDGPGAAGSTDGTVSDAPCAAVAATIVSQVLFHFSKALSLPVSLGLFLDASKLPGDAIFEFARNLAPRLRRFFVSVEAKTQEEVEVILTKLLGRTSIWPIMWDLDINLRMGDVTHVDRWCGNVFTGSSSRFPAIGRLKLTWRGVSVEQVVGGTRTIQGWNLLWSQLSHLYLGPLPIQDAQDIVNVLHNCTNLERSVISIIGSDNVGPLSQHVADTTDMIKSIELPNLRYLDLAVQSVWDSKGILDRLSLPALERFAIIVNHLRGFETPASVGEEEIDCILTPLTSLFQRSKCSETLVDLRLDLAAALGALDSLRHTIPIEDLFASVPRLKKLVVTGYEHLPHDLLDHLPISVDYLEVQVKNSALDYARQHVAKCLDRHCRARQLENNGVPQDMKAIWKIWVGSVSEKGKELVRSLELAQGEYESAAKLIMDMD